MNARTEAARTQATTTDCDPVTSTTKTLLAYGVIAGPIYVVVSLAQALTRDGFDLTRHAWSMLSNGDLGWLQITNFVLAGLMTIAGAVGVRRALRGGSGARWAPRLLATYGVCLVGGGIFRADPGAGFPVGSPEVVTVSWHGMLHFLVGGIGFACFFAATLVLARRIAAEGRRDWAVFSRVAGSVLLVGFIGVAAGGGSSVSVLGFVVAVILAWTWLSSVSASLYRRVSAASA
jgi:hypothetical membrane protein